MSDNFKEQDHIEQEQTPDQPSKKLKNKVIGSYGASKGIFHSLEFITLLMGRLLMGLLSIFDKFSAFHNSDKKEEEDEDQS